MPLKTLQSSIHRMRLEPHHRMHATRLRLQDVQGGALPPCCCVKLRQRIPHLKSVFASLRPIRVMCTLYCQAPAELAVPRVRFMAMWLRDLSSSDACGPAGCKGSLELRAGLSAINNTQRNHPQKHGLFLFRIHT